ncbi:MAG: hypothetical protein NUW37_16565 [Planctomycetes bacterium]|nr:hypothetical protein [Planctomycetota bacterium]
MLIRLVLAVDEPSLLKQFQTILMRPDILVITPSVRRNLWEWVRVEPADAILFGTIDAVQVQHVRLSSEAQGRGAPGGSGEGGRTRAAFSPKIRAW